MKLNLNLFKGLQKLNRRKGENRLKFFKRQFKGQFTKAQQGELHAFIQEHGFRPMEPIWPGRGCYILAAADVFEQHPMRDRYLSALMLGDLVWAFPKLQPVLIDKIKLVLESRASRYKKEQKEKVNEKQIRLLIRNLQNRNRSRNETVQKRTTKRYRDRNNEEA